MIKRHTYFQSLWLSYEQSKDWLSQTNVKTQASCKQCQKTLEFSSISVQAHKPCMWEKHCVIEKFSSFFFKKKCKSNDPTENKLVEINHRDLLNVFKGIRCRNPFGSSLCI